MSGGFVKIYGSILDSSVWQESKDVRLLWIALLAMADAEGKVDASLPGLAKRAGLEIAETLEALATLESPDPFDRSGVEEGRRIATVQGGWFIHNYERYRELRTQRQIETAKRVQEHRAKKKAEEEAATGNADALHVTDVTKASTSASLSPSGEQENGKREIISDSAREWLDSLQPETREAVWLAASTSRRPPAAVASMQPGLGAPGVPEAALWTACMAYAGNEETWNHALWRGYCERAKRGELRVENKARTARETEHIEAERRRAAAMERAEVALDVIVAQYEREHPAEAAELRARTERAVRAEMGSFASAADSAFLRAALEARIRSEILKRARET